MQSTLPIQVGAAQDIIRMPRSIPGKFALAVSATAFVAVCAHVSIPLYFTPVPITLQTMAVILIGLVLGPSLGASAMVLYLAEGAIGLPVFSPQGAGGAAQLLGPTAGFLYSYPLAAAAAGGVYRAFREVRPQLHAAVLGGFAASLFIFAMGAGWIAHLLHLSPRAVWVMAVAPFLPGEVLKIAAAAGLCTTLRRWRRS